jgi:hypothetical protein
MPLTCEPKGAFLKTTILALFTFLVGMPQGYCTRSAYFVGSATSNFTVDMTSFWNNGNTTTTGNGGVWFTAANFGCRIFIYNPSPTPQTIQSTSYVDQTIEYPFSFSSGTGGWVFGNQNPFFDFNSVALQYAQTNSTAMGSAPNVVVFSMSNGSANGASKVALPQTLTTGQGLIIETKLAYTDNNVTYNNGWLNKTYAYPWTKLHHSCSGEIDVDDGGGAGTAPGFVIATGELDYLASSYQNQPLEVGGYLRRGDNNVSTPTHDYPWSHNQGLMQSTMHVADNSYAAAGVSWGPVCSCNGNPTPGVVHIYEYSAVTADAYCNTNCTVDNAIDNTNSRSSFMPAHMFVAPIFINGGGPI